MANHPTDLDQLSFEEPITSEEGLDVNHTSRARIQFLAAQSHALLTQTQFADAKAAALMTLSGVLMLNGPAGLDALAGASLLTILSFVSNMACIAGCILAISPRFPPVSLRAKIYASDRFSWPGLVDRYHAEQDFPDFMRHAQASQLVLSMARANQASARVLHRKFAVLRTTFLIGLVGVVFLGADRLLESFRPVS